MLSLFVINAAPSMVLTPRACAPRMAMDEAAAKSAWLAKLDAPAWGPQSGASGAVYPTSTPSPLELTKSMLNKDAQTISEDAAKKAWLAKLDTPTWGATPANNKMSEDEAKKAWLAKLDVPTWGGQAAPQVTALMNDCEAGDDVACGSLVMAEEEAKKAWLAKLDVPTWGRSANTAKMTEEAAKKAWLAKLDVPSWGKAAPVVETIVNDCEAGNDVACDTIVSVTEEAAKKAWLAKLETPSWGGRPAQMSEEAAKRAWLAKLDVPSWGQAAPTMQVLVDECGSGDETACNTIITCEEEAKRAWLARLDTESFRETKPRMTQPLYTSPIEATPASSEVEAKKVWLSKLDTPSWGNAAPQVASLMQDCDAGVSSACETIMTCEEDAKRAWLARLDMESFRDTKPRMAQPNGRFGF